MVYTDIQTLRGLDSPTDYGSGIEYADGLASLYYSTTGKVGGSRKKNDERPAGRDNSNRENNGGGGLQIGLWLNGTAGCRDILKGSLDTNIQQLLDYIIISSRFEQIFLRVGYEFDNPDFGYSDDEPDVFQEAFRYIVQACRDHDKEQRKHKNHHRHQQRHDQYPHNHSHRHHHDGQSSAFCMDKTVFVWHSWASSLTRSNQLARFYPGNDYVDWIGISLFSQLYSKDDHPHKLGTRETVQAVLDFAKNHGNNKPVMIAESTPFGGIPLLHDPWQDWFAPALKLIQNVDNNIAMWSYINCDWTWQPMWHDVGFGNTRLAINETIMKLWQENVLQNPRFLQYGSLSQYCNDKHHRHHCNHRCGQPCHDDNKTVAATAAAAARIATTLDLSHSLASAPTVILSGPEMEWASSILGILGLLVVVFASCGRFYRKSSTSNGYHIMLMDDNDDGERGTLIETNRTEYGSIE